jgi:radical SAM superfamily enzyme YgiQ (UPF0313 family)/glycosyltransferase involved in cell wall biosynthesis
MRIVFDGTTLRPQRTGVGYYSEHLLRHLAARASDELVVISNRPIDTTEALPSNVRVVSDSRRPPRMAWMQLVVPKLLGDLKADVAHFTNGMIPLRPPARPTPLVVTIHDMSLTMFPRYHPPRRVVLNRPQVNWAAHRAAAVITVSHSAKHDIDTLYKLGARRVHVVHEAAAPSFRPVRHEEQLRRVRRRYGLADRVILYVGTIEPRKNLSRLIEAFAEKRRTRELSHQLVCAGPYGWLSRDITRRIERLGIADAIRFVGYVPFDDLPALYTLSEMFVFPSLYEGFGLPVVEAMACGVPVIAARAASLVEITQGAVEYVDPYDVSSLANAMASLAACSWRRDELSALGRERARTFSWDRAADETLGVYRSVVYGEAADRVVHEPSPILVRAPRAPAGAAVSRTAADAPAAGPVLLGQAYFLRFDPKLWQARQPYAPLGTLYAASYLRTRGYDVRFFDAMLAESEAEWSSALDAAKPRAAVIYEDSFNYLSKMCLLRMRQAALTMVSLARDRGVTTVVAGSDATDHPSIYLDRGAAAVVLGEGEVTLADVLDRLAGSDPQPLYDIPGVAFLDGDGRLVRTTGRETIKDLDALPFPAWDLVDVDRYRAIWRSRHGFHSMNVVTTRGCPYHCNWCARPIYGQRYTSRTPENVVAEISWLADRYKPDHLWIADDIFGLKPGWIERFADLVAARGLTIPFKCLLRADQVTDTIADALRAAGCRTAWIGAESGSQRVLDAMEKGTRVGQIAATTRVLRARGIEVGFFLQFGYPGETRDDIERTLQMVRDCAPDDIGVSVSYPLPGTPFYERVKSQLGAKRNWVDSDDLTTMYRATYVPAFYQTLHRVVHGEFRARRATRTLRRIAAQPWTIRWRDLRQAARGLVHAVEVPWLRRRLDRLASLPSSSPTILPMQVLKPEAAAIPAEHGLGTAP